LLSFVDVDALICDMLIAIQLPSLDLNEQELHCARLGCPCLRMSNVKSYFDYLLSSFSY